MYKKMTNRRNCHITKLCPKYYISMIVPQNLIMSDFLPVAQGCQISQKTRPIDTQN